MSRSNRSDVFEPESIGVYHCYNRVVRRCFLCGFDSHTKRDYSHRRTWLYERLKRLAEHFAIDVLGYAILSNHYHLVLRNRPDQVDALDDRQVVTRWLMICPSKPQKGDDGNVAPPPEATIQLELNKPGRVAQLRGQLSNPSWLIRQMAQYMGIRCNAEDQLTGHFWESRFGMKRLLDQPAVLACLAYVDLNPYRAAECDDLEAYRHVSIGERLRGLDGGALDASSWLAPLGLEGESGGEPVTVVNRLGRKELDELLGERADQPLGCLPIGLERYAELLRWLLEAERRGTSGASGAGASGAGASGAEAGSSEEPTSEGVKLLRQWGLDPSEFAELVRHFDERFSTAAGSPRSLREEAARRGKGRLNGAGRHALASKTPPATVP